jgi:hypothetical protein
MDAARRMCRSTLRYSGEPPHARCVRKRVPLTRVGEGWRETVS